MQVGVQGINMEINDYKLTSKLIISCIVVFMWIWLVINLSLSKLTYEDCQNAYNRLIEAEERLVESEERFNKLWNKHLEVLKDK